MHMTRTKSHGEIRTPHGAMENVKALLRVANHLDADTDKEPPESLLFHGLIVVVPTLLGLAAKLALKALYMREEGTSPKSHDLLDLFERLPAGVEATSRTKDAKCAESTPRPTVGIPRHSRGARSKPDTVCKMALPARTLWNFGRNVSIEGSDFGDHRNVRRVHTVPRNQLGKNG